MTRPTLILLTLLITATLYGQHNSHHLASPTERVVFDTLSDEKRFDNPKYYAHTDFTKLDTLDLWNFELDTTYKGNSNDTLKALAQLHFWRTRAIDDKISYKIYGHFWTPNIFFDVYPIADSAYCYKRSNQTRLISSCVPPDVGGDIIRVGNFIFVSRGVCLSCQRHDTKVDYCRPVINYIFSKVDPRKATTPESLCKQFVIKSGIFSKK